VTDRTTAPATEIKAVVFDVMGVLVRPPAVDDRAPAGMFGPADADSDHPWHRLERGEITLVEAQRSVGPPRSGGNASAAGPVPPFTLVRETVTLAEQLAAAGLSVALCTNAVHELTGLWSTLYPWAELFPIVVRSCEEGVRKPDPELYRRTLTRLGVRAEETLVLDDSPANLEAASRLGMRTVLVGTDAADVASAVASVRAQTGVGADAPRVAVGPPGLRRPAACNDVDELLLDVLFDKGTRVDPFPLLHRLRTTAPVHRLGDRPVWYASRYEDCRTILRDPRFVKVPEGPALDFITGEPVPPTPPGLVAPIPFLDPPEHTAIRAVMGTGFTKAALASLRPRIEAAADELLTPLLRDGRGEVVERVSYPLAIQVICDLVGVPSDERADFRRRVREAALTFEPSLPPDELFVAVSAIFAMTQYFTGLAARARRGEVDGLLPALLAAADDAGVTDDEVVASVVFLFSAGFETVAHLVSTTLYLLASHPEQYALVAADPALADAAVTEAGRVQSPVQLDSRMVGDADVELSGVVVPADSVAVTLLGAANRDPDVYPDPDRFDVTRSGPFPLTFGTGIHYCLGARLAAMEAAVVVERLVAAGVTRLRVGDRGLRWKDAMVLRGFDELWVEVS
jgi:cytochrome P450/FMN phosphatase YigB (HAD superfamily)